MATFIIGFINNFIFLLFIGEFSLPWLSSVGMSLAIRLASLWNICSPSWFPRLPLFLSFFFPSYAWLSLNSQNFLISLLAAYPKSRSEIPRSWVNSQEWQHWWLHQLCLAGGCTKLVHCVHVGCVIMSGSVLWLHVIIFCPMPDVWSDSFSGHMSAPPPPFLGVAGCV